MEKIEIKEETIGTIEVEFSNDCILRHTKMDDTQRNILMNKELRDFADLSFNSHPAQRLYDYVLEIPIELENRGFWDSQEAFHLVPLEVRLEDSKDPEVRKYLKEIEERPRAHSNLCFKDLENNVVFAHVEIKCESIELETLTYETLGNISPEIEYASAWNSIVLPEKESKVSRKEHPISSKLKLIDIFNNNLDSCEISRNSADSINDVLSKPTSNKDPESISRSNYKEEEDIECNSNNVTFSAGKIGKLKCDKCNKCFSNENELTIHLQVHKTVIKKVSRNLHKSANTVKQNLHCEICQKTFRILRNFNNHMVMHNENRLYECKICHKSFGYIGNLRRHKEIHTGERNYQCDVCHKTFIRKGHLTGHKIIHTGIRPFQCNVCQKSFGQKCRLNSHMLLHTRDKNKLPRRGGREGGKSFDCDICHNLFSRKGNLKTHILSHTGEGEYQCDFCQKTFALKRNMKRHMTIHIDGKKYQCDICHKRCNRKYNLASHMLRHTNGKSLQRKIRFLKGKDIKLHFDKHPG